MLDESGQVEAAAQANPSLTVNTNLVHDVVARPEGKSPRSAELSREKKAQVIK